MKSTINVVCYKSKTLANGEHPLMVRVSKDGKKKYQSLGISVNPKYWDFKKSKPKPNCPNKELIQKIILEKETEYQKQVLELQSDRKDYTATSLLSVVSDKNKIYRKTVDTFYRELIEKYNSSGSRGNALVYKDSYNSLKTFMNGNLDLYFNEIDINWLNQYEDWLRSKKCAETSISLSFRTLRSAFNKAIEAKIVRGELYPFYSFKISKFDVSTQKRAISKDAILDIMNLDLSKDRYYMGFSKDIFLFSYLCGGINITDIAHLKAENIKESRLSYIRKKTKKKIEFPIVESAMKIIDKHNCSSTTGYIFPILDNSIHKTEIQKYNRIHKVMRKVNVALKEISKEINQEINLTTYVARHTYATVLKRSGVNTSIISESLGHSSEKVTQIYLDSFENSQIDEAMKNLL